MLSLWHDCGDFKHLPRRTVHVKEWPNKAFDITKNVKYNGYQRGLASMAYKHFDEKTSTSTETGS